jgi:hypothetical protein
VLSINIFNYLALPVEIIRYHYGVHSCYQIVVRGAKPPRSALPGGHALLIEASFNRDLAAGLEGICSILNQDESSDLLCQELRKLVRAWQESGPNLRKMLAAHKSLAERVHRGSTFLMPTEDGNGYLGWEPMGFGNQLGVADFALRYFLHLVVHPQWQKFGGPCQRPGCGRYYVKKRKSQKVYCSGKCGHATTASTLTRQRRAEEHADKLSRAQKRVTKCPIRRNTDWKRWLSEVEPDLSVSFLTRAVNKGELRPPWGSYSK